MIDHSSVNQWLQDYIAAWKSYDRDAIAALFSENATYKSHPYDEPLRGREAILANWLENPDPPNTYSAEYHVVAVDGNTAVTNGRSYYYEPDGKTLRTQFDNIFILRFDDEGRCTEYKEWWVEAR